VESNRKRTDGLQGNEPDSACRDDEPAGPWRSLYAVVYTGRAENGEPSDGWTAVRVWGWNVGKVVSSKWGYPRSEVNVDRESEPS
jgi:hypothetical protein